MKLKGMVFALALILIGCTHCSSDKKPVVPPGPETFVVQGTSISVNGTMKAGANISGAHAKSAIAISVSVLEK